MSGLRIAVIDSGKGGRFMAEQLQQEFPTLQFVCITDEEHVPYGNKSASELISLGKEMVTRAQDQDPQAMVLACHTLSSTCYPELAAMSRLPLWNVNTALLHSVLQLKSGSSVRIWGTRRTIESEWFQKILKEQRPDLSVTALACPELATAIETRDDRYIEEILQQCLDGEKSEALALACTHYPVVKPRIAELYSGRILDAQTAIQNSLSEFIRIFPE